MSEILVIVPVYKVEAYLHRCLDSILAQTFFDFEVLLIDDGSPDNCPYICDEYAKKDSRVHVIHQKNKGPSAARNRGIEWALKNEDCRYLTFIDSDDCVHPQYLERLYSALICNNVKVSMCRHRYITALNPSENMVLYKEYKINIINAEDLLITEWKSFNYAWGKLYSKKCFRELRYPENISFGEDNLIIFRVLFESNEIAYVSEDLYYYFYNANGITKSPWTPRSLEVFEGIHAQLSYYYINGYEKAYAKEMELYIQQYAYQIHRIREDRENLKKNKQYLQEFRRQMKKLFHKNHTFYLRDNLYWYEALYPRRAYVKNLLIRLKRNYKKEGFVGIVRKLYIKISIFREKENERTN